MSTTRSRDQRPMLKDQLYVTAWADPTVDALGWDVRDRDTSSGQPPYVETFWLPLLGPTATWLLRRCNSHLDTPNPGSLPTQVLAESLGLGPSISRSSKLADTIDRAERFGFASLTIRGDELRVRTHLPPLTERQLQKLPEPLQALHQQVQRRQQATTPRPPRPPAARLKAPEPARPSAVLQR